MMRNVAPFAEAERIEFDMARRIRDLLVTVEQGSKYAQGPLSETW
jgi:hypothetical protein